MAAELVETVTESKLTASEEYLTTKLFWVLSAVQVTTAELAVTLSTVTL